MSLVPVAVAVVMVWLRMTTIDTIIVVGDSMKPTLNDRDRVLSLRRAYRHRPPQRGDIVVLDIPLHGTEIKRVIGIPGDVVACAFGQLIINGSVVRESYVKEPMVTPTGPWLVPPDNVFVLGDNRNFSEDSRDFGPIATLHIRGKAAFVIFPFERWGPLDHADSLRSLPAPPANTPYGLAIDTSTEY